MAAKDVTLNYNLISDRAIEGHLQRVGGTVIAGTSEGLVNVGTTPPPAGRAMVYSEGTYAGGVILANSTAATLAGFTFDDGSFESNAQYGGVSGTPANYPVALLRKGGYLFIVAEEALTKGDSLFYRCIQKATPGTYEALGRLRNDADNISISNKALTSNVATLTTSAAHGFVIGQQVVVAGITTDTGMNGTFTVASVPSTTTFTYACTNANVTSASSGGTIARAAAVTGVRLLESVAAGGLARISVDLPL